MRHGTFVVREELAVEQEVRWVEAGVHGLAVVVDEGFVRRWGWWQGEIKRDVNGSVSRWRVGGTCRYPAVEFDGRRVLGVDVCIIKSKKETAIRSCKFFVRFNRG